MSSSRRRCAARRQPFEPVIRGSASESHGCSVVRCCTWDRRGVFARLTGAFTAAGVNILSAAVYTRGDGIVVDTFHVTDPSTGAPLGPRGLEKFATLARQALTGEVDLADVLRRQAAMGRPTYAPSSGERFKPAVVFDTHSSPHQPIIEVDAEDRLGLLYVISTTLAELGVDISLARINTTNGVASDAFYVREAGGGPIPSAARQKQIRAALLAAISGL